MWDPFGYSYFFNQILSNQGKIMSALTDLQAAEAAIATAVQAAVADIQKLSDQIKTLPSVSDADAEAITSQLNTLAANLNAAVGGPAA